MLTPTRDTSSPKPSPATIGYTVGDDGEVCLQGRPVALAPKERGALCLLLSEWPRTVHKDRFANQVWRGRGMSDESLARCIAQLRRALLQDRGLRITAVYGTGYRLQVSPQALPDEPASGASHGRLLHAAMATPQHVEVLTHARQLMQRRNGDSLARAQNLLRELVEQAPAYPAARLALAECVGALVSCGLYADRNRIEEALGHLEVVRKSVPHLPGLLAETAHLLDGVWRFDEAAAFHALAHAQSPLDAATYYYRGWHLLATDQPEMAVEALEKAVQLHPFSAYMAVLLARALINAGAHERALERASKTLTAMPDDRAAAVHQLGVEALVAPSSALAKRARSMARQPIFWVFEASTLAYVLARCGHHEEATRMVEKRASGNPAERAAFAAVLTLLGRTDEAVERVQRAAQDGCGHLPVLLLAAENSALRSFASWAPLAARVWGPTARLGQTRCFAPGSV